MSGKVSSMLTDAAQKTHKTPKGILRDEAFRLNADCGVLKTASRDIMALIEGDEEIKLDRIVSALQQSALARDAIVSAWKIVKGEDNTVPTRRDEG